MTKTPEDTKEVTKNLVSLRGKLEEVAIEAQLLRNLLEDKLEQKRRKYARNSRSRPIPSRNGVLPDFG